MSAEENKAVVRRYFEECWNQGDLTVMEELRNVSSRLRQLGSEFREDRLALTGRASVRLLAYH